MDNVATPRRRGNTRGNKENTQPDHRNKAFIKGDKTSVVPFQLKGNQKEETLAKDGLLKAQDKQGFTRPVPGKNPKNMVDGRRAVVSDVKRRTHSQVFLTEQAQRHKKTVREAPKPPAVVPSSKPAPGMYKGRIIQSKIGSIWKSSDTLASADLKPSAPKAERKVVGSVAKNSVSKSAAEMSGRGIQHSATTRYKSVSDRSAQVSKSTANSYRPAGVCSARPAARTVPAASVTAGSRKTNVAPLRPGGNQGAKPKAPVTDKVKKPVASSSLSQYRLSMETAEERRAKLAEWLASKGKVLKRPTLKTAAPSKTNVSAKPEPNLKTQSHADLHLAEYSKPEHEDAQKPDPAGAAYAKNVQEVEQTANRQTAEVMNTSLELLENSDADLPDYSQGGVDDIVVNLCDALEAMVMPSTRSDELVQVTDDVEIESKTVDECDELKPEMSEDVCEKPKVEHIKNEECSDQKVEDDEESDESVLATPPSPMADASIIRYSVKTTPYLQSVKKTIEEEVNTSTSRRASNIKDLKFLTPVRRSTRLLRSSSRLPAMLADHDPCVSSLAELVKLDDSNAYIYRKNPALLDDLPDQDNV
ncbi:cytoskeleton-associated protein 2 [Cololabis saira]|uniref:cytoskeleton-associated protein 2 n=1 Tax=Cololabis saira TaxID=129043 RepID=UPI002AD58E7D|nr:cytoskeleton-associated protein 2 [Cololabis saira]